MFATLQRSWDITKVCFRVISKDKEMLLFPLFAGIFSVIFTLAMLVPTVFIGLIDEATQSSVTGLAFYALLFVVYLGLAFIMTFFNVCVVYTAKTRFEGGDATLMDSVRYALSRIHLIFAWSLLAAVVGIILRVIEQWAQRLGRNGEIIIRIITGIIGGIWSIATIFVVPAMVYRNLGPIDAIKQSVNTLKKTWGESLVREFGLGLVQFIILLAGAAFFVLLMFVAAPLGAFAVVAVVALGLLYLLGVILVFSVANTVFNTALYVYAEKGKIPAGFDKEHISRAFGRKA